MRLLELLQRLAAVAVAALVMTLLCVSQAVAGGPIWVGTVTEGPPAAKERWHLADEPAGLRALLGGLGVLEAVSGSPDSPDFASRNGSGATGPDATTGWWWAIPGLAAGALVGFAGVALVRRGTARRDTGPQDPGPPGPRRQLIDV